VSTENRSVTAADPPAGVSLAEMRTLFAGLSSAKALLLAVSGGPDSTALMVLAARWRKALKYGPKLFAATIDHGLRAESAREARAVKQLARSLRITHRTVRWTGVKPKTGLQEAAREARYALLAAAAREVGAAHILTAHTLDDQAETVLLRLARGSGPTGLAAMARETILPEQPRPARKSRAAANAVVLVRPLLAVPKARLIATLEAGQIPFSDDPSNRDPRFTRARLRELMPMLAVEGLSAQRLAQLAHRLRRAEATIELAVGAAAVAVSDVEGAANGRICLDAEKFIRLPAEVALRLVGRAIRTVADDAAPLRLHKLEALYDLLAQVRPPDRPSVRVRRTLAGALITLAGGKLVVERAPPRSKAVRDLQGRAGRARA
jgi:tRNA(Ile)-lysidine synthase